MTQKYRAASTGTFTSFTPKHMIARLAVASSLVISHPLLAQDTTEIHQNGEMNRAEIEQVNASSKLFGYVNQDGDYNLADLYQEGPVETEITARVTQYGTSNEARTEQSNIETSALVESQQSGTGNTLTATQADASEGTINIDQNGDYNNTDITQRMTMVDASVTQTGFSNDTAIDQLGEFFETTATVYQHGERNVALVRQPEGSGGSIAVRQTGSSNVTEMYQAQEGLFGGATASVTTNGNSNWVHVVQDGSSTGQVDIIQSGDFNRMEIEQTGELLEVNVRSLNSSQNHDTISQFTLRNRISLERASTDRSDTMVDQQDVDSTITIEQSDAVGVDTQVTQDGGFTNQAAVRQLASAESTAIVYQDIGFESSAHIEQSQTNLSTARIHQYTDIAEETPGENLTASIYQQDGTDLSYAEIEQTNTGNVAVIRQIGAVGAEAYILQTGAFGNAEIVQTGSAVNSSATINQSGEGYSAAIHQTGGGNEAIISQL